MSEIPRNTRLALLTPGSRRLARHLTFLIKHSFTTYPCNFPRAESSRAAPAQDARRPELVSKELPPVWHRRELLAPNQLTKNLRQSRRLILSGIGSMVTILQHWKALWFYVNIKTITSGKGITRKRGMHWPVTFWNMKNKNARWWNNNKKNLIVCFYF